MARFWNDLVETDFISGMIAYQDHYPEYQEKTPRIVLRAYVYGKLTSFIVDTGSPWCIINPLLAQPLIDEGKAEPVEDVKCLIRGYQYDDRLFIIPIKLKDQHDSDRSIEIEATVFVPMVHPNEVWNTPNFIGLNGFLNRIRFAIDPEDNTFYFGEI